MPVYPRPTAAQTSAYEESWQAHLRSNEENAGVMRALVARGGEAAETMRQIWHAGCFLEEWLEGQGAPEEYRKKAGFDFGRACLGRETWPTFDKMVDRCRAQLAHAMKKKEWANVPVPQDPPAPTSLFDAWYTMSRASVGEKGVFPMQLCRRNAAGEVTMEALAVDGNTAFRRAVEAFGEDVAELVVGVDLYAVPGQGITTNDFLAVVWYVGGRFYAGVVEYQKLSDVPEGQEGRFDPVRWDNNYWAHSLLEHHPVPAMREAIEGR